MRQHARGGSPREGARSEAEQRLAAGGCKLPRPGCVCKLPRPGCVCKLPRTGSVTHDWFLKSLNWTTVTAAMTINIVYAMELA